MRRGCAAKLLLNALLRRHISLSLLIALKRIRSSRPRKLFTPNQTPTMLQLPNRIRELPSTSSVVVSATSAPASATRASENLRLCVGYINRLQPHSKPFFLIQISMAYALSQHRRTRAADAKIGRACRICLSMRCSALSSSLSLSRSENDTSVGTPASS